MRTSKYKTTFRRRSFFFWFRVLLYFLIWKKTAHHEEDWMFVFASKLAFLNANHPFQHASNVFSWLKVRRIYKQFHQTSGCETHFIHMFICFLCRMSSFWKRLASFFTMAPHIPSKINVRRSCHLNTIWNPSLAHHFNTYNNTHSQ